MKSISLCMIVKNEEHCIGNCLESVHDIVDEIIIVDSGSTDNTVNICKKYTDKIFTIQWIYDFSFARNFSISQATSDYLMFLDADDVLTEENRERFKKLKNDMTGEVDMYYFTYDYLPTMSFDSERIFRNYCGVKWEGVVHEQLRNLEQFTNRVKTNIHITHTSIHDKSMRYVDFFRKNKELGHRFNDREKYYFADELWKNGLYEESFEYLNELISENSTISDYERAYVYELLGMYHKNEQRNYSKAIECFLKSSYLHQPLLSINFSLAECYRNINHYNMCVYYCLTIVNDMIFPETFVNNVVMGNFEEDTKRYKIKALLILVMVYYYDLHDAEKAKFYNEMAFKLDPTNETILTNRRFFNGGN